MGTAPGNFKHRLLPAALLQAVCLLVLPAQAQWKWRAKDGSITVSDRPPSKDIADKDILGRPNAARRAALPASAAASAPVVVADGGKTALEREVEARRRIAEQEQSAKAKTEEARLATQRGENCQRARSQQAALEGGQRIARLNDKGEREVLDDKGRAEELRQAREVIASECR